MNEDNKAIKCNVKSCKFNNENNDFCTLNEIKVSCTCDACDACKKETICDSFKERNN